MTFEPGFEAKLRQSFKQFNKFMLLMWRLGLGSWINIWPQGFGRIMVVTHKGRKTGLKWQTPVNYTIINDDIYCVAGFGKVADWYKNMLKNPKVEIWLPDGWWAGTAEDISDAENRNQIMREVLIASGFAAPMFGLDPKKLSETALAEATQPYRLVRIRRTEARTGSDGPGDLWWVWPLATFLLLPLALSRRRKR
jgi:deazaflavin-dependent oxidoreductase (nitroreductase family)